MSGKHGSFVTIYLDQNKWIDLARAWYKIARGAQYAAACKAISRAANEDRAALPLSSTHVFETWKIGNRSRKERLAEVMATISRGWALRWLPTLWESEMAVAVSDVFDLEPVTPTPVLCPSILFALGTEWQLKLPDGQPIPESAPAMRLAEALLRSRSTTLEILLGEEDAESAQAMANYLREHAETARRIDEARTAGRAYSRVIRKRAYAANVMLAVDWILLPVLEQHGKNFEDFCALGKKRLMSFWSSMPSFDVGIELATEAGENYNRATQPNDIEDILGLGQAIAYCDIVVTEKHWGHMARRLKLDKKYRTAILTDLNELLPILEPQDRPRPRPGQT